MFIKPRRLRTGWASWRHLLRYWVWLCCWVGVPAAHAVSAQAVEAVSLIIQLRDANGTAVSGETLMLERLPEAAPVAPSCTTDASGRCSWMVTRGLYQVLFEQPLDDISALALAEGGLRGFGLTVGDAPIIYHFTLHHDDHIYFDAAPDAARPQPIIPKGELLHGGFEPWGTPSPTPFSPTALATTASAPTDPVPHDSNVQPATGSPWQLLAFLGGGLGVGAALHLWSQKRRSPDLPEMRPEHSESDNA